MLNRSRFIQFSFVVSGIKKDMTLLNYNCDILLYGLLNCVFVFHFLKKDGRFDGGGGRIGCHRSLFRI